MKMLKELAQINIVADLEELYEQFDQAQALFEQYYTGDPKAGYKLPRNQPVEQLNYMMDAGKRALELAQQLTNPEEQDYHLRRVLMIMKKIEMAIQRRIKSAGGAGAEPGMTEPGMAPPPMVRRSRPMGAVATV